MPSKRASAAKAARPQASGHQPRRNPQSRKNSGKSSHSSTQAPQPSTLLAEELQVDAGRDALVEAEAPANGTPSPTRPCAAAAAAAPPPPACAAEPTADGDGHSPTHRGSRAGVPDSTARTEVDGFASLRLPAALQLSSLSSTPRRGNFAGGPRGAAGKDMTAIISAKGHTCTMTYSPEKDSLRITRTSSSGKCRTVLNIPAHVIINVETAAERDERQRLRQANDDTTKMAFAESSGGAGLLCTFPHAVSDGDPEHFVFAHSRVNTDASGAGYYGSLFHQPTLSSPSAMGNQAVSPLSAAPSQIRYYVHYMRQRNRERPTIHSLEFLSYGPAEHVQCVVSALVQRVYHCGPKHILVFISPKSGKGKGAHIFEKHVRPLLHFSRHTYQTYLTTRAHDCEDYVANLDNPLDAQTVVTAVGGDGMINEVVNGVHRRKLALVRWLRSVTTDAGLRGKSEESSQRLGDEGSSCAFGADPQALASLSDAASATTPKRQGAAEAALTGSPNIRATPEENKRCRSPRDVTAQQARRLARTLVEEGWDALMPLIATVPTGSACGLAKSLDVLSVAESAMALVHLSTVHMDLLHMSFTPNQELIEHQRSKLSLRKATAAKERFAEYTAEHKAELTRREAERAEALQQSRQHPQSVAHAITAADPTPPFLETGANVYKDEVHHALRMPHFDNRVAFMSLSFGAANDIDHNSEPLRWMGNARFHVYGGYMLLLGLQRYHGVLRYLPWRSKAGKTMEKLHSRQSMPSSDDFPPCTMREACPHCREYTVSHCGHSSGASTARTAEKHSGGTPHTSRGVADAEAASAAATLAPYSDAELLDEDSVDFDDSNLPWVTIRGEFCIALMCNVRDVAQDMLMAPLAHMADGAIDVVYCRIDPCTGKGGRMEMLKFFMGLESGKHVELDFVNYVKARALEMKVDAGISMSDGELMPLSSVRMTKLRQSVQLVRNE